MDLPEQNIAKHIELLLQQKFNTLNTLGNVGMTWWVSAVFFCGTLLAGTWAKRSEVKKIPTRLFHLFFVTVVVFFVSIISFGFVMNFRIKVLKTEVDQLLKSAHVNDPTSGSDFATVEIGYLIGSSSFILVCVCWVGLWIYLWKHKHK